MGAYEIFNYLLNITENQAVYNETMGKSNKSIYIESSEPITVYALNLGGNFFDATNIFPVEVLNNSYYHFSHTSWMGWLPDAYAVVATQNNTQLYHGGGELPVATLDAGDVYYHTSLTDMTGTHITATKPVAFFAAHQFASIPAGQNQNYLFQQLAPDITWGKNFFVPVSNLNVERVRIVAQQNNTTITQTGGVFIYSSSGTYTINAGEYIELDALLINNGCSIQADKPVGVCSYLTGAPYNGTYNSSGPAQAWLPSIEQMISKAIIAPFIINNYFFAVTNHFALLATETLSKNDTKVSIGGNSPVSLSGETWNEHTSGYSFYNMPLTNDTVSYTFTNPKGLLILCYGYGISKSYYYLAGSAMRELDAAFYANEVHFQELEEHPFCENKEVAFQAEINGLHSAQESIKWYIGGVLQPTLTDHLTWSQTFPIGVYEIKMWVRFDNNDTISKVGNLKIIDCNVSAAFYVNDVHYANLPNTTICTKDVNFRAEVEGLHPDTESLKWYINGEEEVLKQDMLEWSKELATGTYEIQMWVRYANGETATLVATLKVEVSWIKIRNVRY